MPYRTQILSSLCLVFASVCGAQTLSENTVDPRLYGLIPDQPVARLPTVTVNAASDIATSSSLNLSLPTQHTPSPAALTTRLEKRPLADRLAAPAKSDGLTVSFHAAPQYMPVQFGVVSLADLTRQDLQEPSPPTTVRTLNAKDADEAARTAPTVKVTSASRVLNAMVLTAFDPRGDLKSVTTPTNSPTATAPKNGFNVRFGGQVKIEGKFSF